MSTTPVTRRPPESRLRNWLVAGAAYLTFMACALGSGWAAWALVALTLVLLGWAVSYRGRRLFVTAQPELHPVGSSWRRFRVIALEPVDDGFWLVRGQREW